MISIDQLEIELIRTTHFCGFIPCVPIPKQSVQLGRGTSGVFRGYVPKRIKDYCTFLACWWKQNYKKRIQVGPIELKVVYCFPYKEADYPFNTRVKFILNMNRVDVENLTKPLCDSMHNIVFKDDKQVVLLHVLKIRNKVPGIAVQINLLNQKIIVG